MSDHYKSNLLLNKLKKISKLFEKKRPTLSTTTPTYGLITKFGCKLNVRSCWSSMYCDTFRLEHSTKRNSLYETSIKKYSYQHC